jgi:hypothetical protein
MFSAPIRLLCITTDGCECFLSQGSRLVLEARFDPDQVDDFKVFMRSRRRSVFTVLTDQIEEDFRQDSIPYLRGPGRAQLLGRRAGQTYRDTPFHTSVSLGREAQGRRDERVQLMALTNAPVLNQWLIPLSETGIRVAGLFSTPLLCPILLGMLARSTGIAPPRLLVITLNRAGLRQTLLEGNVARFSRIAAIPGQVDSEEFAATCLAEINKTQQYLVGLRLLSREVKLPALIVVPPGQSAAWNRPGALVDALEPTMIDLVDARRAAGLKAVEVPGSESAHEMFADSLWVHALARRRPKVDFAPPWLREAYRLWQMRNALWAAGAVILFAGCAVGAERWGASHELARDRESLAARARSNELNYERIKRGFPPLPAAPEQLKASVLAFEKLSGRSISPVSLIGDIGRALEGAPQFRLERLDWLQGSTAADTIDAVSARGVSQPAAAAAGPDALPERYEIVILYGMVTGAAPAAARSELEAVERTVTTLRSVRAAQVSIDKTPLDLTPRGTLAGGEREPLSSEARAAGVTIRVVRKAGA